MPKLKTNPWFTRIAKQKPKEKRTGNSIIPERIDMSPDAKGLSFFLKCSLSLLRSSKSFNMYTEDAKVLNAIKAIATLA